MDIFNSALKNPDSSNKKDLKLTKTDSEGSTGASSDSQNIHANNKRKKNSRRRHRNSHLGCGTCKKRRIKCDENLPSCFNCLKGKLHCAYLNLDGPARNALRMAQYNQNVRKDKLELENQIAAENAILGQAHVLGTTNPNKLGGVKSPLEHSPPSQGESHMYQNGSLPPSQPAYAVSYPLIQSPISMAHPQSTAQVFQSPYGPLVSLQPLAPMPGYSQVPMPQQVSHVIYPQHPTSHMAQMPLPNSGMQQMPVQYPSMPMPLPQVKVDSMKEEALSHTSSSVLKGSDPNSLIASPKLGSNSQSYTSLPNLLKNENSPIFSHKGDHISAKSHFDQTDSEAEKDKLPLHYSKVPENDKESNNTPRIAKLLS